MLNPHHPECVCGCNDPQPEPDCDEWQPEPTLETPRSAGMKILDPFGPEYPRDLGATVAKFRRLTRRGLGKLTCEDRRAYGNAVSAAIRSKQRSQWSRVTSSPRPYCASGTAYSDGRDISAAIRRQHVSALQAYVAAVRRNRTDKEWRDLYGRAMKEKRERELALAEAATRRTSVRRRQRAGVYSAVLGA